MHKHFRMLSIAQLMRNHGVSDVHTSAAGIWQKLSTLYNLEGLDEREDLPDDPDSSPEWKEFRLPERDFGELMDVRRLKPEGTASPGHMSHAQRRRFSENTIRTVVGNATDPDTTSLGGILSDAEVSPTTVVSPISQKSMAARMLRGGRPTAPSRGGATPRGTMMSEVRGATRTMYTPARRVSQTTRSSEGGEGNETNDSGADDKGESEVDKGGEVGPSDTAEDGGGGEREEQAKGEAEEQEREEDEGEEEEEEEEEGKDEDEGESDGGRASPAMSSRRSSEGRRGRGGRTPVTPGRKGRKSMGGRDIRRSARKK